MDRVRIGGEVPARLVALHSNFWIVLSSRGGGQQYESGSESSLKMGAQNQLSTDPPVLVRFINRQVGEVCAIVEVGDRPRNSDQLPLDPSRDNHVGMVEHPLHDLLIRDRTASGESRSPEQIDELRTFESGLGLIRYLHTCAPDVREKLRHHSQDHSNAFRRPFDEPLQIQDGHTTNRVRGHTLSRDFILAHMDRFAFTDALIATVWAKPGKVSHGKSRAGRIVDRSSGQVALGCT